MTDQIEAARKAARERLKVKTEYLDQLALADADVAAANERRAPIVAAIERETSEIEVLRVWCGTKIADTDRWMFDEPASPTVPAELAPAAAALIIAASPECPADAVITEPALAEAMPAPTEITFPEPPATATTPAFDPFLFDGHTPDPAPITEPASPEAVLADVTADPVAEAVPGPIDIVVADPAESSWIEEAQRRHAAGDVTVAIDLAAPPPEPSVHEAVATLAAEHDRELQLEGAEAGEHRRAFRLLRGLMRR